jgi:hypothetical protein
MTEHEPPASRRARLPRCAGRALLLTGVGAGLWLLGSYGSTASAEESAPAPVPVVALASGLLAPVGDAVPPVVEDAVAPVVEDVVVPVVDPVLDDVVVPVVDPVLDDVVEPIVADVLAPVGTPVLDPVVGALNPVGTPVGEVAVIAEHLPQVTAPADAPQASPATRVVAPRALSTGSQLGSVTLPTTAPVPAVPTGPTGPAGTAPAPSTSSGSWSPDQTPADLSSTAAAVAVPVLRAAAGTRPGATSGSTFDPSFSPD